MRKILSLFVVLLCVINSRAADYTDFLTAERGFTEVTSTDDILTGDYYYIIASAENTEMIVSVGRYEAKPGWAETAVSLRYKAANETMILDDRNFFTIETLDSYIGFRNLFYSHSLFQTNEGQSWIYCNAFLYEAEMSIWDALTPTFQNGYWKFEEGQYPGNFLGPWSLVVAENEPIAGNRTDIAGDEAGHFRLFRISKSDYSTKIRAARIELMGQANPSNPIDASWLIENPSFEQGRNGWTLTHGNPSFTVPFTDLVYETWTNDDGTTGGPEWRSHVSGVTGDDGNTVYPQYWGDTQAAAYSNIYGMTNGDGGYVFNAYNWWAVTLGIGQTLTNIPNGVYELSTVVATFNGRSMSLVANGNEVTDTHNGAILPAAWGGDDDGEKDGTPIKVSVEVTNGQLDFIVRGSIDWWTPGNYKDPAIGFIKCDNFQLKYLGESPLPLPNDETTQLVANKWYYYDAPVSGRYTLTGNLMGMSYATSFEASMEPAPTKSEMGFVAGRIYFKTTRSDATLKVEPANAINSFTAATLNVDGLPAKISIKSINPDGPQSAGTKLISTYLNNKSFDVIAFQEDFSFHSDLTSNMSGYTWGTHRGTVGATALISPANTDGLEFATRNAAASFSNESYVQFNSSYAEEGNQYIKKGYRYYEVTLASGDKIDVFITHMDAGTTDDRPDPCVTSREGQLQQIANAIIAKGNTNRPKIFMGDTNSRWTREDIKANFFDILSTNYDVKDAWVELTRNGDYPSPGQGDAYGEVVDKIIYINPKGNNTLRLTPTSYLRDAAGYVNSSGNPLGDHAPIVVNFGISLYEEVDNTVTLGDIVANDGTNTTDLEALVNILKGDILDDYNLVAADMNGDGEITLSDLTALVNKLIQTEE